MIPIFSPRHSRIWDFIPVNPKTEIEEQQRDSAIDQLLEPYYDGSSEGKGSYSGVPEETKELVTALRSGLDLTQLTLNEAFQFYLTRKAKTNSVERRKTTDQL